MAEHVLFTELGLPTVVKDFAVIHKAYKKAMLKAHPDKPGGSHEASLVVNHAYAVLKRRYEKPAVLGDQPRETTRKPGVVKLATFIDLSHLPDDDDKAPPAGGGGQQRAHFDEPGKPGPSKKSKDRVMIDLTNEEDEEEVLPEMPSLAFLIAAVKKAIAGVFRPYTKNADHARMVSAFEHGNTGVTRSVNHALQSINAEE